MEQKEIQKRIAKEAAKDVPDFVLIEELSGKLVDLDPSRVRFSVDAGHIQRLGVELVAKQDTALSELIKNAYDADATHVSLTFSGRGEEGGTLVIEDDGVGMTEDVVRNAWMRIATESKVEKRTSAKFGRAYAGRKGIGRFAVQRLGKHLIMETRVKGQDRGVRVRFDWDKNFVPGQTLGAIFNSFETFKKDPDSHGTKLQILDLRDAWKDTAVQKVWKSVLLLQPPFPVSELPSDDLRPKIDPGFRVTIDGSELSDIPEMSIESTFLSNALATITGSIDESGAASVRLQSEILDLDEKLDVEKEFFLTGELSFTTKYFLYDAEYLSGISQRAAGQMGRQFGGIRIYRNGFRVLPYGEPNDDWLRLDYDTSRRNILVVASNRNFFGHVELSEEKNILFEETASREGLVENDAFAELQEFVHDAVEWAAKRIAAVRGRKTTAHQPGFEPIPRKPSQVFTELKQKLRDRADQLNEAADDDSSVLEDIEELAEEVTKYEEELTVYVDTVEEKNRASMEYEQMLRLLASLGLSVSVFGHEIIGAQDAMKARLQLLNRSIAKLENSPTRTAIENHFEELSANSARIFEVGGYVSGLVSATESRELESLSVKGSIDRFKTQFGDYLSKQNVDIGGNIHPPGLRTLPMHKSELDSVLLNFLTNSIKSLHLAKTDMRKIAIGAHREGRFAVLWFEDNGLGIPKDRWERVFDAFYTTTFSSDEDVLSGPGTGLGLRIVADIAANYGGYARVVDASKGYSCKIEFAVPAE